MELQNVEGFLGQHIDAGIGVEVGFALDAQVQLFGTGVQTLHAAIREVLPACFGSRFRIEIDAVRNIHSPSARVAHTLSELRPRIVGVEALEVRDVSTWAQHLPTLHGAQVLVHAWIGSRGLEASNLEALLVNLPAALRGVDFQHLACPINLFPVQLLPKTCIAFGTVVLQIEGVGHRNRGNMDFATFAASFPTFPPSVAIVRASFGTERPWLHTPSAIASTFRSKFPGLRVLQLELVLKPSVSIADLPFVDFARLLIVADIRVEITSLRCRPVHYEFLRAALNHAGAVVHHLDDDGYPTYPFSHPKYVWPELT